MALSRLTKLFHYLHFGTFRKAKSRKAHFEIWKIRWNPGETLFEFEGQMRGDLFNSRQQSPWSKRDRPQNRPEVGQVCWVCGVIPCWFLITDPNHRPSCLNRPIATPGMRP